MDKSNEAVRKDLTALFRARNPLIWITSEEEQRVEAEIVQAAADAKYPVFFWDCFRGLTKEENTPLNARMTVLRGAGGAGVLNYIDGSPNLDGDVKRGVIVLRDAHKWLASPPDCRAMRSVARRIVNLPPESARIIIVLTPSREVPMELQGDVTLLEWPLPTREDISNILDEVIESLPDEIAANVVNGARSAGIDAALGMQANRIQQSFAKSLVLTRTIDAPSIVREKKKIIDSVDGLTWIEPDPRGLDAVGGLENEKEWLRIRQRAFSPAAREYGLPAPKGMLMVGVPGCGKSLAAKAIGSAWSMPVIRLDLGALKSKFVGESEGNIRRALNVAETVAPCILWIDEIEKAMAGATGPSGDSGVSADALGAILNWLQERTAPVFMAATANDIESLPPELLRKGRFDEMFFVDLPKYEERQAVLAATLQFYNRTEDIHLPSIAGLTDSFSGAEIASLVPTAMYEAFEDGERPITNADLIAAAHAIVPMSKTNAEQISRLRTWANGRCRMASAPTKAETGNAGLGSRIDLGE